MTSVCTLISAVPFGFVSRRFSPFGSVLLAASIASGAFGYFALPVRRCNFMLHAFGMLAGVAQGGLIVAGLALVSSAVHCDGRGNASALFNLFGSVGIIFAALVGTYAPNAGRLKCAFLALSVVHLLLAVAMLFNCIYAKVKASKVEAQENL